MSRDACERLTTDDPTTALVRLITLGGRLPIDRAIRSLTPWERALIEGTLGRTDVPITPEPGNVDAATTVVIAQAPLGKTSLYGAEDELTEGDRRIGAMAIPRALLEPVNDLAAEEERFEALARPGLECCLERAESGDRLGQLVADVRDRVDHVESVYVYIGRRTFSRSDVGNTLLRGGRLERLEHLPLVRWEADERLFVAAFHVLFLAGRSIRIEEFNGEQLTAAGVRAWLLRKWQMYRLALQLPAAAEAAAADAETLGREVGKLRTRLEAAGPYGFRRINGLTMAKHEILGRLEDLQPTALSLPPLVREEIARLGAEPDAPNAHASVRRATRSALAADDTETVEGLVERVVLSAVLAADADYGMSSGVRDLSRLRGSPQEPAEGLLTLTKSDFFCATLPHPSLVERLGHETMCEVLHSVAKRMQFNRWHFLPGNLEREEVPPKRHFFYPPLMPDIAEWSDLRHPGHTSASVRYTVRAPGPALWRPPLRVFGLELRGCFDIRLVRMTGPPFTAAQIQVACQHCHLIDALWRALAQTVENDGSAAPLLSGFTREGYYETAVWSGAVAEARAVAEIAA